MILVSKSYLNSVMRRLRWEISQSQDKSGDVACEIPYDKPCCSQVTTDCYISGVSTTGFVFSVCLTHVKGPHLTEESGVRITSQIGRCSKVFALTQVSDMHVAVCAVCNHIRFSPGSVASV